MFLPDGISMAKSLGGGLPIGAFWLREPLGDLLGPGTHGTTFGGNPLCSAVALKIMEVIERDRLADNARTVGGLLEARLKELRQRHPNLICAVRGMGMMLGVELAPNILGLSVEGKLPATVFTAKAMEEGLLVIPTGAQVFRLLPALNLTKSEAEEGLGILENLLAKLA